MDESSDLTVPNQDSLPLDMAFPNQNADPALINMGAVQAPMLPMMAPDPISADEIALYDRQIRLWGMKAQELIRTANILIIGMRSLGNEIAKNLVLAGVGGVTILDHEDVTEDDLGAEFLVAEEDVGKKRAEAAAAVLRKMNPRVNIVVDTDSILNKTPDYFAMFNVVVATSQHFDMLNNINVSCRMFPNIKFYAADMHGIYGYIFADLYIHEFTVEKEQSNIPTKIGAQETPTRMVMNVVSKKDGDKIIETVTKQEMYCPLLLANSSPLPEDAIKNRRAKLRVSPVLSGFRALFDFQKANHGRLPHPNRQDMELFTKLARDKHLELQLPIETLSSSFFRSFLQNIGSELQITAAFLGGALAQDIINVLGQREHPMQNFLVFDGEDLKGTIYSMQPVFDPTLAMPMDPNMDPTGGMGMEMDPTMNGVNGINETIPQNLQQVTANGNGNEDEDENSAVPQEDTTNTAEQQAQSASSAQTADESTQPDKDASEPSKVETPPAES